MEEELFKGLVRNLSRLIILWILSHHSYSGYGILKEMRRVTGQNMLPGLIYPLLHELDGKNCIVGEKVQKGKRFITYYSLTKNGLALLSQLKDLFKLPLGSILQELLGE
ncbi:MAG: PadR family transcriptional regulator [Candidatus Bathyarchaeota archaeon]